MQNFRPFEGDPKVLLGPDGSTLTYVDGQPILDRGLENMVFILIFTRRGWCGNSLIADENLKIGSDFEASLGPPITLQSLNDVRDAAEKALTNPIFGKVTVTVTNPDGLRRAVKIRIEPPGQDVTELLVERNSGNWLAQAFDPAHGRV